MTADQLLNIAMAHPINAEIAARLPSLERGVLRINPANPEPDLFIKKARSYQARWPWLKILDGDGNADALPALTAREVGQLLREVVFERRNMTRVDSMILEQAHAGRAVVDVDGWLVTLHSDGEVLEYCETCVSPDGRRWTFDSGDRYGTDPIALLSTWEHQSLGSLLKGSSRIAGKSAFDLQEKERAVPVAVRHTFDDLDLVIDTLQLTGVHRPANSAQDASPVATQPFGEQDQ